MYTFTTLFVLFVNIATSKNIGFYSEKQRTITGITVWTDMYGKNVTISEKLDIGDENIGEIIMKYKSNWNDGVYVGEVVDFVERIDYGKNKTNGRMKTLNELDDLIEQFHELTHPTIKHEDKKGVSMPFIEDNGFNIGKYTMFYYFFILPNI